MGGVIATVRDSNPSVLVTDFTATIDWGDGTQSDGVITASGGTLSVSGGHTYSHKGSFTVSVSLTGAASATAIGTVKVVKR